MSNPTTTQVGGDHYRTMAIQPERFIYENGIGFHEGNAITYLCRWRSKGGLQDLEKAKHFIDLLIAHQPVATQPEPPPPAPTPDAPDPGPGWRLMKPDEIVRKGDQWYAPAGYWKPSERLGYEVCDEPYRTPIYHNPANLETAGEGYRFCLVSETRQDATECWYGGYRWDDLTPDDEVSLRAGVTYRTKKPLPTT